MQSPLHYISTTVTVVSIETVYAEIVLAELLSLATTSTSTSTYNMTLAVH